jgi:hypothetical protein
VALDLKSILGGLAGGRFYADVPPATPTFPLLLWQRVGGQASEYLDQSLPSHDHARVQLTAWAKTRLEADALIREARVAMLGSSHAVETFGAAVADYDDALKLYGSRQDFGIWYTP